MRLLSAGGNEKVNKQVAKQRQSSVQPESVHRAVFILCLKGGQFTEDGSFIGQYVPGRPPVSAHSTPQNPSLQGANAGMATYV